MKIHGMFRSNSFLFEKGSHHIGIRFRSERNQGIPFTVKSCPFWRNEQIHLAFEVGAEIYSEFICCPVNKHNG